MGGKGDGEGEGGKGGCRAESRARCRRSKSRKSEGGSDRSAKKVRFGVFGKGCEKGGARRCGRGERCDERGAGGSEGNHEKSEERRRQGSSKSRGRQSFCCQQSSVRGQIGGRQ